ncbi:hypothetical protein ACFSQ7_50985 [Paenibacillus rhizoplanae]
MNGILAASACERDFALMLADDFVAGLEADPGAMDFMVLRFFITFVISINSHWSSILYAIVTVADVSAYFVMLEKKVIKYPPEGDQVKIHAERDRGRLPCYLKAVILQQHRLLID